MNFYNKYKYINTYIKKICIKLRDYCKDFYKGFCDPELHERVWDKLGPI